MSGELLCGPISGYTARADIGLYGGLISGYTAELAAFVGRSFLDIGEASGGYCSRFYRFRLSLRVVLYREGAGSKLTS